MEGINNMEMNTELVCVVASLGYADGEDYFKGVDCLESLKDMIRFLRHEDLQVCDIRRQMGHAKVLQNDLLPLLINYAEDKELVDIVLRLLVNLTSAPELCFDNTNIENVNATERKTYEMQLISYLQSYKEAFTDKSAMSAIGSHFARILQLESTDREEEDVLLLERILLLMRNLLFVPSNPEEEKRTDDDVTIHDQLLWSFHVNGIDDLLIYLSSSVDEGNWCMHALEIISHMFREQNAEELARTNENRSRKEKQEDTSKIAAILAREKAEKEKQLAFRGARHSRFGGSYWIKEKKALNPGEDLVYHRTLQSTKNMTHDFDKRPQKKASNRRPLQEINKERKSTLSVRLFLKEFCMKFLEHAYNNLLRLVKTNLDAGRTQQHDEVYYITVMRFFMAFNRVKSFRVEFVSQTFGIEAFNFIQNLVLKYLDYYINAKVMKEKSRKMAYAKRLKLAVSAYKELLMYVAVMARGEDENLKEAADIIQSNIFYTEEYRNIFIGILRSWNPVFQTKLFLKDVVEAFHLYLKLFEAFLKDKGSFLAKTKGVATKKTKKKPKPQMQRCPIEITGQQAENLWQDTVSAELSACLQGREEDVTNHNIVPFDPLSDVPVDDQVTMAFASIQRLLRCNQAGKAIAFLRASRECWVEERKFGTANMSMEEEFMCLREIFFMELPIDILQQAEAALRDEDIEEEEIEEEVEEVVQEQVKKTKEKQFDILPFIKKLGSTKIVQPYCYLLKFYKENSAHTNHCIIKMLHRIAVDLKLNAMLFQLSVFITFKKILNEPKTEETKEMRGFAKFILSKFFELYETKPNIVVEILYWKENIECYAMTEDEEFLNQQRKKSKNEGSGKWTFEEEQELIDLYDELKNEDDVIEKIAERLKSQNRTAQQIANKLRRLRILEQPRKRKANEWTEIETDELKRVFEEFKDSDDPLGNIMQALSFTKAKKWVIAHLLETGLVNDRRELHKKRKKKTKASTTSDQEDNDDDDDDGLHIDENEENEDCEEGVDGDHRRSDSESDNDDYDNDCNDDDDLSPNASLQEIIARLVELGFASQIEWVQGRLRRLANEREDTEEDQWQSVPLVPITEDHENAIDSRLFRRMLKRVGVSPPATEQESFWRISRSLSPDELRGCVQDLERRPDISANRRAAQREGVTREEDSIRNDTPVQEPRLTNDNNESDDDDFFENFLSGHRRPENAVPTYLNESGEINDGIDESNARNHHNEGDNGDDSDNGDGGDDAGRNRADSEVLDVNDANEDGIENDNDPDSNDHGEIVLGEIDAGRNRADSEVNHVNDANEDGIENDNDPDSNDHGVASGDYDGDDHDVDHSETLHNNTSTLRSQESTVNQSNGISSHHNDNDDDDDDETQFQPDIIERQNGDIENEGSSVNQNGLNKKKTPLKRDRQSAFDDDDDDDDEHCDDDDDGGNQMESSTNQNDQRRQEKKRRIVSEADDDDNEDELSIR